MRKTFIINMILLIGCVLVAIWRSDWFALLGWLAAIIHNWRAEDYRLLLKSCGINDEGEEE